MNTWRTWKLGDIIEYTFDEFDGFGKMVGVVSYIDKEKALVTIDNDNYWVDDDLNYMFHKISA